jgi:choline dehydrogenase
MPIVRKVVAGYDTLVVGGGAAGCVLAARLSKDPARRVLLIEAGPDHRGIREVLDAAHWDAMIGGPYDYGYRSTPTAHVLGRALAMPRGRLLGGSSSTNAMLWYRGNRADYDAWADSGATGWGYDDLLPYFRRSETRAGGDPAFRGLDGPMRVGPLADVHPIADDLIAASAERGLPVLDDANAASNEGAVYADYNAVVGDDGAFERWSTARAYLEPALARPNLDVLVGSAVHGLVLDDVRRAGGARRGCPRHPAPAAAVRHRRRDAARGRRHPRPARSARRRRELPGPPADPRHELPLSRRPRPRDRQRRRRDAQLAELARRGRARPAHGRGARLPRRRRTARRA